MIAFLILVPLHTIKEVVLHFTPVFLLVGRRFATSRSVAFLATAAAMSTRRSSFSFVYIILNATTLPTALPTLQCLRSRIQVLCAISRVTKLPTTVNPLSSPHHTCSTLYFMKYSEMKFDGSMLIVADATRI